MPAVFRKCYNDKEYPEKGEQPLIEVYTDAASKGNPGQSGAGVYIKANGATSSHKFSLGTLSNHEAEFYAVIKALEICREHFPDEILSFRSDSRVVVDVVDSNHTKNQNFLPLLSKIQGLSSHFPYFFIKWIPEKQNKQADELAKSTIR